MYRQHLESDYCQSQSYVTTDSQSASLSWCQAPIWDPRPIFPLLSLIIFRQLRFLYVGRPLWREVGACSFQLLLGITSAVFLHLSPAGLMSTIFLSFIEREVRESWGGSERLYISGGIEKKNINCEN
jgi:hypothetical protein